MLLYWDVFNLAFFATAGMGACIGLCLLVLMVVNKWHIGEEYRRDSKQREQNAGRMK